MIVGRINIINREKASRFLNSAAASLNGTVGPSVMLNNIELMDMRDGFSCWEDSVFKAISTGIISYNRTDHDSLLKAYQGAYPETTLVFPDGYKPEPDPEIPYDPLKLERVT